MDKIEGSETTLNSDDENAIIIELHQFISELCSYGEELEKLTDPQRDFYYNQLLEMEINNGGFDQYFFNSSGAFAHETILSLRRIGAHQTAEILQQAVNRFLGGDVPKSRKKRIEVMKEIGGDDGGVWGDLDHKFYAYEDDLNSLTLEYIRLNKDSF